MLSVAACSSYWNPSSNLGVNAFGIRKWVSRRISLSRITNGGGAGAAGNAAPGDSSERFLADSNKNLDDNVDSSWSKAANVRSSSPLQVRKRVKAVLEKARTRTGINNGSIKPSTVVAEAASIGGFDEEQYIIQLQDSNPMANGATKNGTPSSASTGIVFPDEQLVIQRVNGTDPNPLPVPRKPQEFDVIRGDIPAAAANQFSEPLPFALPKLSKEQIRKLEAGERIQEQARMGREGSGYVVVDVQAPPYVVWESLLDFESYPKIIPTVREMQLYTSEKLNIGYVNEKPLLPGTGRETRHYGIPSVTRASFILSKFRLNIAAVHKYSPHPDGDYMVFTLDKSCTNMVLKGAKGIWHTVADPDGRKGWTRVYLLCEVQISRALPSFIVDYAADRAMPRATTWLKPHVEHAAQGWLNP